jgi:predicted ABC-type transport system involved in lysophospholipase L1 biosynthesis ATPase subunit
MNSLEGTTASSSGTCINKQTRNIFADEPSGNLDTSAENLHQLFFKLRDEFGQTL